MANSMLSSAPVSPDWVFSSGSNVSVAKDRGWFTSYTPFTSQLSSVVGAGVAVVGIGNVEIPVELGSNQDGRQHGTIRISDVLHAPDGICNILGNGDFTDLYNVRFGSRSVTDRDGRTAAYLDDSKTLFCLKLSAPPVGPITTPSLFLKGRPNPDHFIINADWPDSERARWQARKPYTDAEKTWLKQHYQDEYHFLQLYGLSIYKEEDREEGRALARSLMIHDTEDSEDEVDSNENSFLNDIETDPTSHVADHHFSEQELDWIKLHYRHSGNFLLSYGLKPFDDDDCREGKTILEGIMGGEDELSSEEC